MIEGEDVELFERSLRHATGTRTGEALDAALEELGWRDALAVDTHTAVSRLFHLQGARNVVSSALDQVLAHALGHDPAAVLLPALGLSRSPGRWDGDRLGLDGLGTINMGASETALVVAPSGESHATVMVKTALLPRRAVAGLDPYLGLVEVIGEVEGAEALGPADWPAAVALGQLAVSHELIGASRAMLDLACEHARDRVQFGRPIAAFQAVRHRLAEALVAIEAAEAASEAGWLEGSPQAAAMAKATAGRSARVTARQCQQVLAGIGYTTEHPFHGYARRVLVLDQLLGSTRTLTSELGHHILEHRELPAPLPL